MPYIFSNILPYQTDEVDLFSDDDMDGDIPVSYTHLDVYKRQA